MLLSALYISLVLIFSSVSLALKMLGTKDFRRIDIPSSGQSAEQRSIELVHQLKAGTISGKQKIISFQILWDSYNFNIHHDSPLFKSTILWGPCSG